jgi:D-alanyl-D-alanine carboxypeptidase
MIIGSRLRRRAFLRNVSAGVLSSCAPLLADPLESSAEQAEAPGSQLDRFIDRYMQTMNAPGLTLALVKKTGAARTAGFGYANLELKTPVTADVLFEIGSITKSFVALTLLQLRDEGKLDLQKPILDYLPWLPIEANYGVITAHHLLTHSSGLPDALGLFLTDPQARHVQASKPGERLHYCNVGFSILGHLIQALDRKPWPEAVRSRILEPLGMAATRAAITDRTRAQRAQSYVPFDADLLYARQGRLAPAGDLVFENAAGSIVSTPGDMARYLQMLLNRGQAAQRRIVSEESFTLFSTPYIKAPQFSPTSSYGYGIAIDKLDGHTILRHTGGMVSFASSIHVDLDGGVAAFASINAMQGYRPVPVTQFAVQIMNAEAQGKQPPPAPELPDGSIKNAHEYAGVYTSTSGKRLEVIADGDRLRIQAGSVALERVNGDVFKATAPEWQRFALIFGRAETQTTVVELAHGSEWYTNAKYSGSRNYPEPPELQPFTGFYQAESAWFGSVRVVLRKGKLWADGITPLQQIGHALFRMGDEPETAQFHYVVDGKAQMLKLNGADLWRVFAD